MIVICSDFIAQDHERYLKLATVTVQFAQSFSLFSDRQTHTHTHICGWIACGLKTAKKKKRKKKNFRNMMFEVFSYSELLVSTFLLCVWHKTLQHKEKKKGGKGAWKNKTSFLWPGIIHHCMFLNLNT